MIDQNQIKEIETVKKELLNNSYDETKKMQQRCVSPSKNTEKNEKSFPKLPSTMVLRNKDDAFNIELNRPFPLRVTIIII